MNKEYVLGEEGRPERIFISFAWELDKDYVLGKEGDTREDKH
jgi:hypothetical protein